MEAQTVLIEDDLMEMTCFLSCSPQVKSFVVKMAVMSEGYNDCIKWTLRVQHALEQMLEHSRMLETLVVHNLATSPKMQFFLDMNEQGKHQVLKDQSWKGISDSQWVDTLASLTHDLSSLFHFLHMNPSVCHS